MAFEETLHSGWKGKQEIVCKLCKVYQKVMHILPKWSVGPGAVVAWPKHCVWVVVEIITCTEVQQIAFQQLYAI